MGALCDDSGAGSSWLTDTGDVFLPRSSSLDRSEERETGRERGFVHVPNVKTDIMDEDKLKTFEMRHFGSGSKHLFKTSLAFYHQKPSFNYWQIKPLVIVFIKAGYFYGKSNGFCSSQVDPVGTLNSDVNGFDL